jgi:hypothetical protein
MYRDLGDVLGLMLMRFEYCYQLLPYLYRPIQSFLHLACCHAPRHIPQMITVTPGPTSHIDLTHPQSSKVEKELTRNVMLFAVSALTPLSCLSSKHTCIAHSILSALIIIRLNKLTHPHN